MNWRDEILNGLNGPQAQAVRQAHGPLLVLSGAGSGKTRTIVHRMAWLVHVEKIPARKIVAVTFTNKAAREMKERALALAGPVMEEAQIRTFHSLGLWMLRRLSRYADLPDGFSVWDEADSLSILNRLMQGRFKRDFTKAEIRYMFNTFSSWKDSVVDFRQLEEEVDLEQYELDEYLAEALRVYEEAKLASAAVDFADLLYLPVRIFAQHPEVLQDMQARYTHFLIDEYQDTNFAQYTLITQLASASRNLCVVGDDDQAIYGWRGADVSNILDFRDDYPDAHITKLEENYRSVQPVLDLANEVIAHNPERLSKTLFTRRTGGSVPRLIEYFNDHEEATGIADAVARWRGTCKLREIAVLYRTNAQSRLIEEELIKHSIPYRVYGGPAFFGRKEIKDLLAYLRFLANPADAVSFLRLINNPARGLGEKSVDSMLLFHDENDPEGNYLQLLQVGDDLSLSGKQKLVVKDLAAWLTALHEKAKRPVDLGLLLDEVMERSGLSASFAEEDRLTGTNRLEQIAELRNSMLEFSERMGPDALLSDYLQEITLFTSANAEDNPDEDAVNLMTIHNAKGLEFRHVILAGMDQELFPHYLALREGNLPEERRLLYVAITRAMDSLLLTRARQRMLQGRLCPTNPSSFLAEVPAGRLRIEGAHLAGVPRPQPAAPRIPRVRAAAPGRPFGAGVNLNAAPGSFHSGDKVLHSHFGKGRVLRLEGDGDATKIHIFFEDGKTRKFLLRFTDLKKL